MVAANPLGASGSRDVLALVQLALDEIDSIPLEASVRRATRIANLLNDTQSAVRLGMELRPSGGHPPANAETTKRLMADPSSWGSITGPVEKAMADYIAERRIGDDLVSSHSLAEIDFWLNEAFTPDRLTASEYAESLSQRTKMFEIETRARHHVFTLLCAWERQLTFAANQEGALDVVRWRVDSTLNRHAPDVLNQFNVAFRRLREAADKDSATPASEGLSHALTSCRRILKAVVDIVQPVDPSKPHSDEGHDLNDERYKNRLMEFLKTTVNSGSFRAAIRNGGESLFKRFDTLNTLASKGVHADVAAEEAEYCALHTYLLVGEILLIHQNAEATEPGLGLAGLRCVAQPVEFQQVPSIPAWPVIEVQS